MPLRVLKEKTIDFYTELSVIVIASSVRRCVVLPCVVSLWCVRQGFIALCSRTGLDLAVWYRKPSIPPAFTCLQLGLRCAQRTACSVFLSDKLATLGF